MDLVPSADGTIDVEKLKLFIFTSNILTVYVCTVLGVSFGLYECTSTCTYCAIQKEVTIYSCRSKVSPFPNWDKRFPQYLGTCLGGLSFGKIRLAVCVRPLISIRKRTHF